MKTALNYKFKETSLAIVASIEFVKSKNWNCERDLSW